MKRNMLLFAVLVIHTVSFAQTIRRVSNIPGAAAGANTYSTVAGAIAAATDDDIIYIEPSAANYAGFTVNKRLHFIGNGYFLNENTGTPQNKNSSTIYDLVEFVAGSGGSSVRGLFLNSGVHIRNSQGILFSGNWLQNIQFKENTSGHQVLRNFMEGEVRATEGDTTAGRNITLANNIIYGSVISLKNSGIINNTISGGNGYFAVFVNLGSHIRNNILDFSGGGGFEPNLHSSNTDCSISNNLKLLHPSVSFPSTNSDGSVYSHNGANTFLTASPWGYSPRQDGLFRLNAGSPAIGAGLGGVDAGAFGGVAPYALSGLARIPFVTSAVSSATGSPLSPLQVTISVRSN